MALIRKKEIVMVVSTCLHCAAGNHVDVVGYLIKECSCDPMSTDKNGCTSLHKAALEGSLYVLKYLISKCDCNLMVFDNKERRNTGDDE